MWLKNNILFLMIALIFSFCKESQPIKEQIIVVLSENNSLDSSSPLITAVNQYTSQHQFRLINTNHRDYLLEDTLKSISAIMVLMDPENLTVLERRTLERFAQSGGGIALLDTDINKYSWPWYVHGKGVVDSNPIGNQVVFIDPENQQVNQDEMEELLDNLVGENAWYPDRMDLPKAPDLNRFTHLVLDNEVNEPMELSVLPSGKVLFIEREGKVKLYEPELKTTKVLASLEVHTEGNYEDGLLGLTIDPNYESNNWIYLFYSPVGNKQVQNVSRFRLAYEDSLILSTEKVVIEIPVQRETCCHSAGSLVFGPKGLLYISTGDNTSSKESDGFSPLDERPGRAPFDAQKSSGNTHDLRGKILRIDLQPDGSYKIPSGNLFPKDGSLGRPEIYIMGCRNPFRFSVDAKTGYLYWGDVGPDGGKDGAQGPQSYDEWNQARKPGNFGWPFFVADNRAYSRFDFASGEVGTPYDPAHPVNESVNNTGSRELPPAQTPFIWYEYGNSETWPMLGSGSRSAMAGPVYHKTLGNSRVAFPDYFDGKLFIYEWARSWIKVVSFDAFGNLNKIEPFLEHIPISKPIDIEFGPHGAMYILAYGANYFANNEDAQLIKIEYAEGNRVPIPNIVASETVGSLPLEVDFNASLSFDHDREDSLTFKWNINDSINLTGTHVSFTFNQAGTNEVVLWALDSKGDSASTFVSVRSGNSNPEIEIDYQGNRSFYFDEQSKPYTVYVKDLEDGRTPKDIPESEVIINFNYLPQGEDLASLGPELFKKPTKYLVGRNLMDGSDCATCHDYKIVSRGPSYQAIAERYFETSEDKSILAQKIVSGGNGNWGNTLMAAHPQHTLEEATKMVDYILSLAPGAEKGGLPLAGSISTNQHLGSGTNGKYLFTAYYQDQGAPGASSLSTYQTMVLSAPVVQAESYDAFYEVSRQRPSGGALEVVSPHQSGGYIMFKGIDTYGITDLVLKVRANTPGTVTVHLDSPTGPIWGSLYLQKQSEANDLKIPAETRNGIHDLYFVFETPDGSERPRIALDWIRFVSDSGT